MIEQKAFVVPVIPPSYDAWMYGISSQDQILLIISSICCFITFIIGIIQQYHVIQYISSEKVRHDLSWIIFMIPISTLVSVIGMIFPRCGMFMFILGTCYIMICLTITIRLMEALFGSRFNMVEEMNSENLKINPCSPFIIIRRICKCFPQIKPTPGRIHFIEWLVYQTSFIRIITGVAVMIGFIEDMHHFEHVESAANAFDTISVMLAIYGSELLKSIGEDFFKRQKYSWIFGIMNAIHTAFTLFKVISDYMMKYKLFEVGNILTPEARSQYMASFAYCIFALCVSIFSIFTFNPKNNSLYDQYENVRIQHQNKDNQSHHMVPLMDKKGTSYN